MEIEQLAVERPEALARIPVDPQVGIDEAKAKEIVAAAGFDADVATELERVGIHRIRSQEELEAAGALPPWLGDEAFHRSHRAALLRKDPTYYVPLLPGALAADPDLPYVWPTRAEAS